MKNKIYIDVYRLFLDRLDGGRTIRDLSTRCIIHELLYYLKGAYTDVVITMEGLSTLATSKLFSYSEKTVYCFSVANTSDPILLRNDTVYRDIIESIIKHITNTYDINVFKLNVDEVYIELSDMSTIFEKSQLYLSLCAPDDDLEED